MADQSSDITKQLLLEIHRFGIQSSNFAEQIGRMIEGLDKKSKNDNDAQKDTSKSFRRLTNDIDGSSREFREFETKFKKYNRSIIDSIKSIKEYSDDVKELNAASNDNIAKFKDLSGTLGRTSSALETHMYRQMDAMKASSNAFNDSVKGNGDALGNALSGVADLHGKSLQLRSFLDSYEELSRGLKKSGGLFNDEIKDLTKRFNNAGKDILTSDQKENIGKGITNAIKDGIPFTEADLTDIFDFGDLSKVKNELGVFGESVKSFGELYKRQQDILNENINKLQFQKELLDTESLTYGVDNRELNKQIALENQKFNERIINQLSNIVNDDKSFTELPKLGLFDGNAGEVISILRQLSNINKDILEKPEISMYTISTSITDGLEKIGTDYDGVFNDVINELKNLADKKDNPVLLELFKIQSLVTSGDINDKFGAISTHASSLKDIKINIEGFDKLLEYSKNTQLKNLFESLIKSEWNASAITSQIDRLANNGIDPKILSKITNKLGEITNSPIYTGGVNDKINFGEDFNKYLNSEFHKIKLSDNLDETKKTIAASVDNLIQSSISTIFNPLTSTMDGFNNAQNIINEEQIANNKENLKKLSSVVGKTSTEISSIINRMHDSFENDIKHQEVVSKYASDQIKKNFANIGVSIHEPLKNTFDDVSKLLKDSNLEINDANVNAIKSLLSLTDNLNITSKSITDLKSATEKYEITGKAQKVDNTVAEDMSKIGGGLSDAGIKFEENLKKLSDSNFIVNTETKNVIAELIKSKKKMQDQISGLGIKDFDLGFITELENATEDYTNNLQNSMVDYKNIKNIQDQLSKNYTAAIGKVTESLKDQNGEITSINYKEIESYLNIAKTLNINDDNIKQLSTSFDKFKATGESQTVEIDVNQKLNDSLTSFAANITSTINTFANGRQIIDGSLDNSIPLSEDLINAGNKLISFSETLGISSEDLTTFSDDLSKGTRISQDSIENIQKFNEKYKVKQSKSYEEQLKLIEKYGKVLSNVSKSLQEEGMIINEKNKEKLVQAIEQAEATGELSDSMKILKHGLDKFQKDPTIKVIIPSDILDKFITESEKLAQDSARLTREQLLVNAKENKKSTNLLNEHFKKQNGTLASFVVNATEELKKAREEDKALGYDKNGPAEQKKLLELQGQALKQIASSIVSLYKVSKDYLISEYNAGKNDVYLGISGRIDALMLRMGEKDFTKTMIDAKQIWQRTEGGQEEMVDYLKESYGKFEKVYGSNAELNNKMAANYLDLSKTYGIDKENVGNYLKQIQGASSFGLSIEDTTNMVDNLMKSNDMHKIMFKLGKSEREAKIKEIQNMIGMTSALGMSKESVNDFVTALNKAGLDLTPQERVSNVGNVSVGIGLLQEYTKSVGIDFEKETGMTQKDIQDFAMLQLKDYNELSDAEKESKASYMMKLGDVKLKADQRSQELAKSKEGDTQAEKSQKEQISLQSAFYKTAISDTIFKAGDDFKTAFSSAGERDSEKNKLKREQVSGESDMETYERLKLENLQDIEEKQSGMWNSIIGDLSGFDNFMKAFNASLAGGLTQGIGSLAWSVVETIATLGGFSATMGAMGITFTGISGLLASAGTMVTTAMTWMGGIVEGFVAMASSATTWVSGAVAGLSGAVESIGVFLGTAVEGIGAFMGTVGAWMASAAEGVGVAAAWISGAAIGVGEFVATIGAWIGGLAEAGGVLGTIVGGLWSFFTALTPLGRILGLVATAATAAYGAFKFFTGSSDEPEEPTDTNPTDAIYPPPTTTTNNIPIENHPQQTQFVSSSIEVSNLKIITDSLDKNFANFFEHINKLDLQSSIIAGNVRKVLEQFNNTTSPNISQNNVVLPDDFDIDAISNSSQKLKESMIPSNNIAPDFINSKIAENNANYTPNTTITTPENKSLSDMITNADIFDMLASIDAKLVDLSQIKLILSTIFKNPDGQGLRVIDEIGNKTISQIMELYQTQINEKPKEPPKEEKR